MADKIKGITVSIGGDTGPLSKALKAVNKEIKDTQTQLKEVEKLLKLDPKNTELLKEKQKLLGDQIKSTKKELDALKQAQKQAAEMLKNGEIGQEQYDQLAKKIEKAEGKLSDLQKEAETSAKKLKLSAEKIGTSFQSAGEKIENAGKKLAPFSAAAAAGLTATVKAASDWETAFTGVKKTVDATAEEYDELGEGIQKLAQRTSSSAEEIAGVAEVAGQLGVGVEDILEFTETMVNLGDTTNVSASDAATALAKFVNITGSSKKDIKKLGSAVVALGNNFATDEASIIAMSQRLASAGTIAGLSETEIMALAAAMSSVGIEAEAGGTAMTQTLTGIEKIIGDTSDKGKKKLKTLAKIAGMSAEDFADAWGNDPIKALTAFIGGLGELDEQGESSTAVLDELGMSGVRQSNMLKSLGLASETLASAVGTASSAYEKNTALTEEAEKRYNTFESQVSQTKEALKAVAADLGQLVLPVVKDLLDGVKSLVEKFKGLDDSTKKTILTITGIVAAAAPVLITMGKVTTAVGSIIKGIKNLKTAFSGIGGPIALVVAGLGTIIGLVVSYKQKLKSITQEHYKLTAAQEALKSEIDTDADAWKTYTKQLKTSYSSVKAQAGAQKDLWQKLTKVVDATGKVIEGHEEEAKVIAGELAEALGIEIDLVDGQIKNYKDLADNIDTVIEKKKAQALLTAGEEAYTEALTKHAEAAQAASEAEYDVLVQQKKVEAQEKKVEATEKALAQARADGNDETGAMQATISALTDELNKEKAALEGDRAKLLTLKNTYTTAKSTLQDYDATLSNHDALQEAIASGSTKELKSAMTNFVNNMITAETGTAESLSRQTLKFLTEYSKQREIVKNTGSQEAKEASYEMSQLVTKSIAELRKLNPQLADQMQKQLDTINDNSKKWNAAGKTTGSSYSKGVKDNVSVDVTSKLRSSLDKTGSAYTWGSDMMKSYSQGMKDNTSWVTNAAHSIAQKIKDLIGFSEPEEGPLSNFHTFSPDMMKLFAQGIDQNQWQVVQAAQGVAASLKNTLEGTTLTAQLDKTVPIGTGLTLNIANFNNYSSEDIRELTGEIMETAANFAARKGAVFA